MISNKLILKAIICIVLLVGSTASFSQTRPEEVYEELFVTVQLEGIFPDSKTFPDCTPVYAPSTILNRYRALRESEDFDLKRFVLEHFQLPVNPSLDFQTDTTNNIQEHINALWPVLTRTPTVQARGSLISLPQPYIVPGGRFREIYYWDSYFTMLGLQVSGEHELIRNMVDNFAFLINTQGFIPNGNRTYYLSRSQPPFFSLMVNLLAEIDGDQVLEKYVFELQKEYDFWMDGSEGLTDKKPTYRRVVRLQDGEVMNRYFDDEAKPRPESYKEDYELAQNSSRNAEDLYRNLRAACESGWDFSSRWLEDANDLSTIHTTEIIPVDLNSLMYHLETILSRAYAVIGDTEKSKEFEDKSTARATAIQKYFWSDNQKYYADFDFTIGQHTNRPSLAAAFPLYFSLADSKQAKRVASRLKRVFLRDGGLITTNSMTGQQWDAPNGWAPLHWIAYRGLKNYDQSNVAQSLAEQWIFNNIRVFQNTGKLAEKYNVTDVSLEAGGGEYPVQDGFGWSNGVLLKLMEQENMLK